MGAKTMQPNLLQAFIALFAYLALTGYAHAGDPKDIFIRTGMYMGNYQGKEVENGTFSTDITLEGELWLYSSSQEAWVLHGTLANESKLGRTRYFGGAVGKRFFLGSDGIMTQEKVGGDLITIRPSWAYFVGGDLGMGQFLAVSFGDVLSSYATVLEAGGVVGIRRLFSPRLSVDALLGYSYAASVASSTNVTVTTLKAMLGFGYSF